MYATSLQLFMRLLPFVALAVLGETAIQVYRETLSHSGSTFIVSAMIWGALAFHAHALILLPTDRDKTKDTRRVLGFVLRTFGLGLLVMIPMLISIFMIAWALVGHWDAPYSGFATILGACILCAVFFVPVFSLLGTLLPASVVDRGRGFGAACSRGSSQFGWLSSHLLMGPVLLTTVSLLVLVAGEVLVGGKSSLLSAQYTPNIPVFFFVIISHTIEALATITLAWALSTAFLRAEEGQELEVQHA